MNNEQITEKIIFKNGHIYSSNMFTPTKTNEIFDELLQKEKEFAGSIYYQRCLEKNL